MPDPRSRPDDRPNVGSRSFIDELQGLEGEEMPADQDAMLEPEEIEQVPETTDTERYLGEGDRATGVAFDAVDGARDALRAGETDDPYVASDEGLAYVPPMDPPVVPSDEPGGADIPGDAGVDEAEGAINAQIREALRADASTSPLADRVVIGVVGSTATLRGVVDGPEDGDAIAEVASTVQGITEVRDETEIGAR